MRVIISRLEGGASVEKCTGVAFLATFNLQGEEKYKKLAVCVAVLNNFTRQFFLPTLISEVLFQLFAVNFMLKHACMLQGIQHTCRY